ncbi:MAG: RDD family protein [Acidobacteriota bacterium]
MNDTVREELQSKVAVSVSGGLSAKMLPKPPAASTFSPTPAPTLKRERPEPPPAGKVKPAPSVRIETSDLRIKKTSPTLVGFQSKNAALPDWRLQLQNSIRQRTGTAPRTAADEESPVPAQLISRGANALKAEPEPEPSPAEIQNPRVANALKRIEESRKAFLPTEKPSRAVADPTLPTGRNYPFNVVSRTADAPAEAQPAAKAVAVKAPKPKLVSSLRIEKRGLDTNKLPPLPKQTRTAASLEVNISVTSSTEVQKTPEPVSAAAAQDETKLTPPVEIEAIDQAAAVIEEQDDLAPIAMRFNSGLFDVIISVFASLILMSPFMIAGGSWISVSGALAIGAATSIVMFLYLTISVGFYGRTFGMRLFSLELIDIEENDYPTLHQAAVNSSVFILSIACAGLGFIPMLLNDERRAAHDLLSGTILVREY